MAQQLNVIFLYRLKAVYGELYLSYFGRIVGTCKKTLKYTKSNLLMANSQVPIVIPVSSR